MTCVKTGARIYFHNYGCMVVGDVYAIGDTFIFRWIVDSQDWDTTAELCTHEVHMIEDSNSWWHRDDLGVTVVPQYLVTAWAER